MGGSDSTAVGVKIVIVALLVDDCARVLLFLIGMHASGRRLNVGEAVLLCTFERLFLNSAFVI